jgi:hypothetical protein
MKTRTLITAAVLAPALAAAAPLRSAEVTRTLNDVRLSTRADSARPAAVGERITGGTSLLTGRQSRAELTFPDRTITRIGANSIFRFRNGTRDMEIRQGSFLLSVPANSGGATIRTGTVTAAITGTTTMMEYSPGQWVKFITLEGNARLSLRDGGPAVDVPAGQMIVMRPDAAAIPRPVVVNVNKLVKSSNLMMRGGFNELPGEAGELVGNTIREQNALRGEGRLVRTGLVVRGPDVPRANAGTGGAGEPRNPVLHRRVEREQYSYQE